MDAHLISSAAMQRYFPLLSATFYLLASPEAGGACEGNGFAEDRAVASDTFALGRLK